MVQGSLKSAREFLYKFIANSFVFRKYLNLSGRSCSEENIERAASGPFLFKTFDDESRLPLLCAYVERNLACRGHPDNCD